MDDFQKFTQQILNLRQINSTETIKKITLEERDKLYKHTNDLTGYCKYIASQIEERLKNENIHTYWIDLNDIISIDHVVLIAEFNHNSKLRRILIDPTYTQFTKNDKYKLINLKKWPSELLDNSIVEKLLKDGIIEIDDNIFKKYINSFKDTNYDVNLDEYLFNQRIGKKMKK